MGKATKAEVQVEPVKEKKQTYSERAAEFLKKSEMNHERFLKTLEGLQQSRGKAQAAAKLRWALGLDDKPTKS